MNKAQIKKWETYMRLYIKRKKNANIDLVSLNKIDCFIEKRNEIRSNEKKNYGDVYCKMINQVDAEKILQINQTYRTIKERLILEDGNIKKEQRTQRKEEKIKSWIYKMKKNQLTKLHRPDFLLKINFIRRREYEPILEGNPAIAKL
ncbi:unnamed protein product [Paramecium pentaurelia]|uniref:Uncharacterized protein n=1 Tax=Paramecium pentaurelia TaxID=43138 RepID=A0A8S1YLI0_9CILI|nr:unnamed protein product [Paramecium pentaurelia]